MDLAITYMRRAQYKQADSLYEQTLLIQQQVLPPDHPFIAITYRNQGEVALALGQKEKARAKAQASLDILDDLYPEDHNFILATKSTLGAALFQLGRLAEAEPLLQAAYDSMYALKGPTHTQTQKAHQRLKALQEAKQSL